MSKDDKKSQTKQQKKLLKSLGKLEDRVEALEDELDEIGAAFDDETDALAEAFGRVITAGASDPKIYADALEARYGASAQMRDYVGELESLLDAYDPDASDEELDDFEARIACLEHDQRVDELEQAMLEAAVRALTPEEGDQASDEAGDQAAPDAAPVTAEEDEDDAPVRVHVVEIEED